MLSELLSREAPSGPTTELQLRLVGAPALLVNGAPLRLRTRKAAALIGYLGLSDLRRERRERLVGLLWSESEEAKAQASLRQAVREVRQACRAAGIDCFEPQKLSLALALDPRQIDVWDVIERAEAGRIHPLLLQRERCFDGILDGLDDLDPSFRIWLLARRQSLKDRLMRALERTLARPRSSAGQRASCAEAILRMDPTHEHACRVLMSTRAAAGDVAGAVRAYNELWDVLGSEYDVEPSLQTRQLIVDIKLGRAAASQVPEAAGERRAKHLPEAPARPSARVGLLIGPFAIEGGGREHAHLLEGFRHHLVACLVRFREWYVVDRPDGRTLASDIVDSALGSYIIEARAYGGANELRVVLTMKSCEPGHYVWSERLDLSMANWFEVHRRVVRQTAMALNVHLSAERLGRLAATPDVALDVYDQWLRGQSMIFRFDAEGWARASVIFANLVEAAPDFAPAHSSLAQLFNTRHLVQPGRLRSRSDQRLSLEHARHGVQIDPIDSRLQLYLAWSEALAEEFDQAELHAELAAELNDNDPWTQTSAALLLAFCGNSDKARSLAANALDTLAPVTPVQWAYHATMRFLFGDDAGSVAAAKRAGDAIGNIPGWHAAALARLGRTEEAAQVLDRFFELNRARWMAHEPPTDDNILRWFLQAFPIRRSADWERLRDGLVAAGAVSPRW